MVNVCKLYIGSTTNSHLATIWSAKGKKNKAGQFIPRVPRGIVTIWPKISGAFEYEKGRVFANEAKRVLCEAVCTRLNRTQTSYLCDNSICCAVRRWQLIILRKVVEYELDEMKTCVINVEK